MYSNHGGYTATTTTGDLNLNPFISDPSNPHTRYPDISSTNTQAQSNGYYMQNAGFEAGYQFQPQLSPQQSMYASQQQQQPIYAQPQQQGYDLYSQQQTSNYMGNSIQGQQFAPSSSFGQQLVSPVNGSSYGYLQGQQQQPNGMGGVYNQAQAQIQNNPGYLAQFDPYAPIGQGWGDSQVPQQQQLQQQLAMSTAVTTQPPTSPTSSSTNPHPRDYIRTHKGDLESWDTYSWKQLFNTFETLKVSWETRKTEIEARIAQLTSQLQYGGGYNAGQIQQEGGRLQALLKQADSNFDSVAASSFQMHEVFAGYRQSGDAASKRRVRESCNAALQSLPEWPGLFQ